MKRMYESHIKQEVIGRLLERWIHRGEEYINKRIVKVGCVIVTKREKMNRETSDKAIHRLKGSNIWRLQGIRRTID